MCEVVSLNPEVQLIFWKNVLSDPVLCCVALPFFLPECLSIHVYNAIPETTFSLEKAALKATIHMYMYMCKWYMSTVHE